MYKLQGPAFSRPWHSFRYAAPEGPLGVRQLAAAFAGHTRAIKGASKLAHSKGFASAKKLRGKMYKLQKQVPSAGRDLLWSWG